MHTPAHLPKPDERAECGNFADSDDSANHTAAIVDRRAHRRDDAELDMRQAAAHATREAIARWRRGQSLPEMQVASALSVSSQERWYAHTLQQLQQWRASGGFAEPGPQ